MPVEVRCQRCGRIMYLTPSYTKRIKNCPSCKNSHHRKVYHVDEKEFKKYYRQRKMVKRDFPGIVKYLK